jgi:hypothetical protein
VPKRVQKLTRTTTPAGESNAALTDRRGEARAYGFTRIGMLTDTSPVPL